MTKAFSEDDFNRYYGQRIKMIRTAREIEPHELAEKVGVSATAITHLERGAYHDSMLSTSFGAFQLALALDCSVNDLFGINVDQPFTEQGAN